MGIGIVLQKLSGVVAFFAGNELRSARPAESVQRPGVAGLIVSQHINVTVAGAHTKIHRRWGIPLVLDFFDLQGLLTQNESERALVAAVACITLHAKLTHIPSKKSKVLS